MRMAEIGRVRETSVQLVINFLENVGRDDHVKTVERLDRQLASAQKVLGAVREQAVIGEDLDAEGGEEAQHIEYRRRCKVSEQLIREHDRGREPHATEG